MLHVSWVQTIMDPMLVRLHGLHACMSMRQRYCGTHAGHIARLLHPAPPPCRTLGCSSPKISNQASTPHKSLAVPPANSAAAAPRSPTRPAHITRLRIDMHTFTKSRPCANGIVMHMQDTLRASLHPKPRLCRTPGKLGCSSPRISNQNSKPHKDNIHKHIQQIK